MKKITILSIPLLLLSIFGAIYLRKAIDRNFTDIPRISTEEAGRNGKLTVIAKNLFVPWAMDILPDKSAIFTEREGKIKIIKDGKIELISEISEVHQIGEGGLLGIAVHPKFSLNNLVYVYYTYGGSNADTLNKVVSFKLENNSLTNKKTIIDSIPGSVNHNGGRIKFGPDGYLYITTGDAQNPSLAQNKNSLAGKILRVKDDGSIPPDNPFNNPVYSYGHRNSQGLTWDNKNRLWSTEHGPRANDELNLIEKGKNYGWPEITGSEEKSGMKTPIINSGAETWAPAGLLYSENTLFFVGLRSKTLFEFSLFDNSLKRRLENKFGRMREIISGSDGFFYITTSNQDGRGAPSSEDDLIISLSRENL